MHQQEYCFFVQLSHNVIEDGDDEDIDTQTMPDREVPSEFVCRRMADSKFIREIPVGMLVSICCYLHFKFSKFDNTYRDEDVEDMIPVRGKCLQGLPELLADAGFGVSILGSEDEDPVPPAQIDYQRAFLQQIKFTSWDQTVEIIFTQHGCGLRFRRPSEWSKIRSCVDTLVSALKTFDPAVDITAVISTYEMCGIGLDMNEATESYVSTPPINQPDDYLNTVIDAMCLADGFQLSYRCVVDADPIVAVLSGTDKLVGVTFEVEHKVNSAATENPPTTEISKVLDLQKRYINMMFWNVIKDKWLQRRGQ